MTAIITKYHGPTNTRGSRITAYANGHKATIPYPYELSGMECHLAAAEALVKKMGWGPKGELIGGGTDTGYAFVFKQ